MNSLSKFIVESLLKEAEAQTTVLFPGGFKPPHGGHLELAIRYAEQPTVGQVIVLIGPEPREGITRDQSIAIWRELTKNNNKILIQKTEVNSPLAAAYKFIETAKPGAYALAASSKGDDYKRVQQFVSGHQPGAKYAKEGVEVVELPLDTKPLVYKERSEKAQKYAPGKSENGKGISASVLRADLKNNDQEAFATNYPNVADKSTITKVFDIVKKKLSEEIAPSDLFSRMKARFKDFIQKVNQEKEETKQAFALIAQAAQGKRKLTPEEQKQVGEQMRDVLKTMGLGAATMLPGGTIYFLVIKLLKLEKYTMPSSFIAEKAQLSEGGGAGHLAHPYEDLDLTFADIKEMIKAALSGKLEYAQEKLDGQNLLVTYKDGRVRAARNKTELKNFGQESKTIEQVAEKFAGRGAIQAAFVETMRDLESAINKLDKTQKEAFFKNGERFLNIEILYPDTQNVIPYGATLIRMHHFKQYDQNAKETATDNKGVELLQSAFDAVQTQASEDKTFEIGVTNPATIKQDSDFDNQQKQFIAMADAVKQKYKLGDETKVSDYVKNYWTDFVKDNAKRYNYEVPADVLDMIVNRWAFTDKSISLPNVKAKIANDEFANWFINFDKGSNVEEVKKRILRPIEQLFLKLGVRVLKNVENLTAVNPNDSTKKIKQNVSAAIRGIQSAIDNETIADNDKATKFLKRELTRLKDIGGFEAIVPTEGVVFRYKGKLYKLTGAFAPVNQLLGYLRF